MCQVIVKEAVEVPDSDGELHPGSPEHRQEGALQRCNERPIQKPVELTLRTHGVCHQLGKTSGDGQLAVPLPLLDQILSEETVAEADMGELLVNGKEAGQLALHPIVVRAEKTEKSLAACGRALAEQRTGAAQLEQVLGDLFTLHLHGVMDGRIDDCRRQLLSRMHRAETEVARVQEELDRAQVVLAGLQKSGRSQVVPPQVRKNVQSRRPPDKHTVDWAVKNLPAPEREVCSGVAKGLGAATAFLITKGAPGLAVAIVSAVWGEQLQSWFVERCANPRPS